MLWLRILLLIAAAAALYWFLLRPILRRRAELADFYATCDSFYEYVAELFRGWKIILWSRFLVLAGLLLPALELTQTLPWTQYVPAQYQPYLPLAVALIGMITEGLRRVTNTPAAPQG